MERQASAAMRPLTRTQTLELQHSMTVGKTRSTPSKAPMPPFGGGKPYPPHLPNREDYVVEFDGPDDPQYPQNWPLIVRLRISVILAFTSFCSTLDSAIFSSSGPNVSRHFGIGLEVSNLTSTLYIIGYAFGPLVWAPLSELRGRRPGIIIAMFGFSIFNTAVAVSKDLQTLMICRFFCGVFGSSPLALVAAIFSDIYNSHSRGKAITVFVSTVFLGPLVAPFVSGFLNDSSLGWRWTGWIPAFMGYAAFVLNLFFLRESYPPVILIDKATELRRRLGNWGVHSKQEEIEVDFKELIVSNFSRPLRMLVEEPVILAVTVYLSFIYGLLYCFLTAYAVVFEGVYGFDAGIAGLTHIGMVVGVGLAALYGIFSAHSYNKKLDANGGVAIPEWRLSPVIYGGVIFALGIFWFGWTGFSRSIHWIVPTLSGLFTGFGLLIIFVQLFNYLIDTYLMFAASAIAANTFVRSLVAAGFPLFSRQMFANMHIQWASTLLGCLAAVLVPIPIGFVLFGKRLRMKSKFAPFMERTDEQRERQAEQGPMDGASIHGRGRRDSEVEGDSSTSRTQVSSGGTSTSVPSDRGRA